MITIDLAGPQGNAFFLLGYARQLALQLNQSVPGIPYNDRYDPDKITLEMKARDYEHLKKVFLSYFGEYVEFIDSSLYYDDDGFEDNRDEYDYEETNPDDD
jgi:hypothetical protein